jgi:hypothetical protein
LTGRWQGGGQVFSFGEMAQLAANWGRRRSRRTTRAGSVVRRTMAQPRRDGERDCDDCREEIVDGALLSDSDHPSNGASIFTSRPGGGRRLGCGIPPSFAAVTPAAATVSPAQRNRRRMCPAMRKANRKRSQVVCRKKKGGPIESARLRHGAQLRKA